MSLEKFAFAVIIGGGLAVILLALLDYHIRKIAEMYSKEADEYFDMYDRGINRINEEFDYEKEQRAKRED